MQILAERLKSIREQRGLLQKKVAADLNMGNTTLSNYEKNVSTPPPELLVALADYYNTSADYLLGRTDDPSPETYKLSETDRRLVYLVGELDEKDKNSLTDFAAYLALDRNRHR